MLRGASGNTASQPHPGGALVQRMHRHHRAPGNTNRYIQLYMLSAQSHQAEEIICLREAGALAACSCKKVVMPHRMRQSLARVDRVCMVVWQQGLAAAELVRCERRRFLIFQRAS